jgi:hypothetical protein
LQALTTPFSSQLSDFSVLSLVFGLSMLNTDPAFMTQIPFMAPSRPIVVVDFGGKEWTSFDGQSVQRLSTDDFLRLDQWCKKGAMLIAERAHLGCPRTNKSLAQVYTAPELQDFYRYASSLDIEVRLFPQSQSPKARAFAGIKIKDDVNDTQAIYAYVLSSPSVLNSLQHPPRSFEPERWREAGWIFKDDTNVILNVARRFNYKTEGDKITSFVIDNLERLAAIVPDDAKEIFGLLHRKKDGSFYALDSQQGPSLSKLYTLAALLLNEEGNLRLRSDTGRSPGIGWLMRTQIATTPFHYLGGIARSNIMWHGCKNYVVSKMGTRKAGPGGKLLSHYDFSPAQTEQFRQLRKTYMQAQRTMLSAMKSLLV